LQGRQGKWPFENTKKLPFAHSPDISLVPIMFWSFAYSRGYGKVLLFDRNIKNKDGLMCRGFLLDHKILYFEPKLTFKEIKMVRNKQYKHFS